MVHYKIKINVHNGVTDSCSCVNDQPSLYIHTHSIHYTLHRYNIMSTIHLYYETKWSTNNLIFISLMRY